MLAGVKSVHCIGVGGVGVGALAELLFLQGYRVSGSDLLGNTMTKRLSEIGIDVWIGSQEGRLKDVDLVVYSSAVPVTDLEFMFASQQEIPCVRRGELMAYLFNLKKGIAIAGSHGKTTTTSMVSYIIEQEGWDPTYCIGGVMNHVKSPVRLGGGEYFIAESDESDKTFLSLRPQFAIVTNIDRDHLNNYQGDYEKLLDAFVVFLNRIPPGGAAILNTSDAGVRRILPRLRCNTVCFSLGDIDADFVASNVTSCEMNSVFCVNQRGRQEASLRLRLPGKHNVANALGAYALSILLGVDSSRVQSALSRFQGVGRRFFCHGKISVSDGEVVFLEDYGHHPSAIHQVISAVRHAWPERRLVMVFEPHRFSRTQNLWKEFVAVLSAVDCLILTKIYAASEAPVEGVSARLLSQQIASRGAVQVNYVEDKKELPEQLLSLLLPGDIILFQGAGANAAVIPTVMESLI
jgi:UDP-N-acetylmuramate--alanine ligase